MGGLDQENAEVVVAGLLEIGVTVGEKVGMLNVKDFRSMFVVMAVPSEVFWDPAMLHIRAEVGGGRDDVCVGTRVGFVAMMIVDDLPVEVLLAFHFCGWQRGRRRKGGMRDIVEFREPSWVRPTSERMRQGISLKLGWLRKRRKPAIKMTTGWSLVNGGWRKASVTAQKGTQCVADSDG